MGTVLYKKELFACCALLSREGKGIKGESTSISASHPRPESGASDVVLWVMLTVLFPYHAICKPIFVLQKRACLGRADIKEHEGKLSPGQRAALLCDVPVVRPSVKPWLCGFLALC